MAITNTIFKGIATYKCNTGFVLFENETVECLASANWSSQPFCSGKKKTLWKPAYYL